MFSQAELKRSQTAIHEKYESNLYKYNQTYCHIFYLSIIYNYLDLRHFHIQSAAGHIVTSTNAPFISHERSSFLVDTAWKILTTNLLSRSLKSMSRDDVSMTQFHWLTRDRSARPVVLVIVIAAKAGYLC